MVLSIFFNPSENQGEVLDKKLLPLSLKFINAGITENFVHGLKRPFHRAIYRLSSQLLEAKLKHPSASISKNFFFMR